MTVTVSDNQVRQLEFLWRDYWLNIIIGNEM